MPVITPTTTIEKCSNCQSPLILVETETIRVENHRFPVTVTEYKCSDPKCQAETDKKTAVRLKNLKTQEQAKMEREKSRLESLALKRTLNKKTA